MDKSQRIRRWETLAEGVAREDVTAWRRSFVAALEAAPRA